MRTPRLTGHAAGRLRRLACGLRALACCLPAWCAPAAPAQPAVPALPPSVEGFERVSDRVWAFVARDQRSANGALFIGAEEALAVDPGLTPAIASRFLEGARAIAQRPLRTVVLTHGHADHAQGVSCMADASFTLVSSPQTRRALAESLAAVSRDLAQGATAAAERAQLLACAMRLPEPITDGRREFDLGGHTVVVWAPGVAHTAGDLVVWSPADRVLATGDLFINRASPDMKQGSVAGLLARLDGLLELPLERVIPGHFEVAGKAELARFRDYVRAVHDGARRALDSGGKEAQPDLGAFKDLRQFPQYAATFADNLRAAADQYRAEPARPGASAGFAVLRRLKLGRNPHQIAFSPDGRWAYVAIAGERRIARVDVASLTAAGAMPVAGAPLGVRALATDELLITHFDGTTIERRRWGAAAATASLAAGAGPSLITGPLPDGSLLAVAERADRLLHFSPERLAVLGSYATGARPFPPAATSDGCLAFVPNYQAGTVTVVDLWNARVRAQVAVGAQPSGGAVLPLDHEYAVAVRGGSRIAFINTASRRLVSTLSAGIGEAPFSVVVAPSGRLAFVNNTASHDISVIALPEKRVIARIAVGEIPIVMAVHPSGETLWVACEGTHEVDVIRIPQADAGTDTGERAAGGLGSSGAAAAAPVPVTEVALLGTIHGTHRSSRRWGLDQLRRTIEAFRPDVVIAEIPPDRWPRIWDDYASRGVIEDSRVRAFPEYVDVLLPLKLRLGFEVEPAAAWTEEMNDLRQARIAAFGKQASMRRRHAAYQAAEKAAQAQDRDHLTDSDDPRVIHSERYDELTRIALGPYDEFLNDWIGPGGWTNINVAHYRLVDAALRRHAGKRILITFGASHKYWLAEQLRMRDDIRLLDITPFLPPP